MEAAEDVKVLFQPLVGTFRLTVCLGVVCGADVLFDVKEFAEFLCEGGGEAWVLVGDIRDGSP